MVFTAQNKREQYTKIWAYWNMYTQMRVRHFLLPLLETEVHLPLLYGYTLSPWLLPTRSPPSLLPPFLLSPISLCFTPMVPKGALNPQFLCLHISAYEYNIIHMSQPSYNVLLLVCDFVWAPLDTNLTCN